MRLIALLPLIRGRQSPILVSAGVGEADRFTLFSPAAWVLAGANALVAPGRDNQELFDRAGLDPVMLRQGWWPQCPVQCGAAAFSAGSNQGKMRPLSVVEKILMTAKFMLWLRLPILMLLACFATACATQQTPGDMPATDQTQYDMNSWKEIIGSDCRAFFDGCNNCVREPGKMAACTRKACAVYQRPRCLDGEAAADSTQPMAANLVE